MRKLNRKALLRHLREQGEPTGALLITFRDGQPQMTDLINESDRAADAMITAVISAIHEPASGEDVDSIGPCAGRA
ncbi:hypothetical protein [Microvirga yunnanensis]|uniref:hypothetical protein n=1 Tax=Microvirga yunnanensis TaxID=2953740 RepID=UPI0021C58994|nr:hypothetical protein [Microvirga sp. HBU67655]